MYPQDPYYRFQMAATLRNMKRLKDSLDWFRCFYERCPDRQDTGPRAYFYTFIPCWTWTARPVFMRQGTLSGRRSRYWENRLIFVFYAVFLYEAGAVGCGTIPASAA